VASNNVKNLYDVGLRKAFQDKRKNERSGWRKREESGGEKGIG